MAKNPYRVRYEQMERMLNEVGFGETRPMEGPVALLAMQLRQAQEVWALLEGRGFRPGVHFGYGNWSDAVRRLADKGRP